MSGWLAAGVGLGGAAGAVARLVVDTELTLRRPSGFPLPTLLINVLGSLLLGLLTGAVLFHGWSQDLRVVLGTGFCGGFTTFSTASYASVRLAQEQRPTAAAVNALGTLALTVLVASAGLALASL